MTEKEKEYSIKIKRIEGYKFEIDFNLDKAEKVIVDEDPPQGKNEGGDPSRMLAASIAHCTMSSLLFCMEKSRGTVDEMGATAFISFGRDENKRLRITGIDLDIDVKVPDADKTKLQRCIPIFEDFCTVTQSVRKGIDIKTEIKFK
jgi:uncharacterized OsmC-like protein